VSANVVGTAVEVAADSPLPCPLDDVFRSEPAPPPLAVERAAVTPAGAACSAPVDPETAVRPAMPAVDAVRPKTRGVWATASGPAEISLGSVATGATGVAAIREAGAEATTAGAGANAGADATA
jgi:hypothetical protein